MAGKGKVKRTDRKKGVPFKMMFRHHQDPSYYDPRANDKIFVPDVGTTEGLTEEQKRIVESFPERDRGMYKEGEEEKEEDPLEAAVMKMKIRKEHRIQQKQEKLKQSQTDKSNFKVKFADDQESSDIDSADYFQEDDEEDKHSGDEDDYDSEDNEDDEVTEEKLQDGVIIVKTKAKVEDANRLLAKAEKFKAAEGVKFVRYDQYGVPMDPDAETGFDYQRHIARDDMAPGEGMYIEAPPEMVAQMYAKPKAGIQRDVDKEFSKMTPEEREVFQCLEEEEMADANEDSDAGYDELEDDFLMLANEGKPALVEATAKDNRKGGLNDLDDKGEEYSNKNVVFVRDEEAEELKRIREELKKRFGGLIGGTSIAVNTSSGTKGILKKQHFAEDNADDNDDEEEVEEEEVDDVEGSQDEELDDERFQERLDREYAPDQIGDAEGEIEVDEDGIITAEALDDAVNEFIESQKIRDRKLYKEFSTETPELVPIMKKVYVPTQEELDDPTLIEREKEELRKKALARQEVIDKEDQEKGSDEDDSDKDDEDSSEDDEKKWDCATILTTHTNTDNHPALIKTKGRIVKAGKQRIELHKQFKVPLDGLVAEEISTLLPSKRDIRKAKEAAASVGPYHQVVAETKEDESSSSEDSEPAAGPQQLEKAQRKKQLKEEKREKRKLKKELKLAFKTQSTKLVKANTCEAGAIRAGISVKKIF